MKATLNVINQMHVDGVIGPYAIGGAIAATFYLEPVATFDIDVFVSLKTAPGSSLVTLEPLYNYLQARGCKPENEYVIIEGWQVQFLPPTDALDREALAEAIETSVEEVKTRVMTAEHLVAIALRTGRPKDKIRMTQFIESGILDEEKLKQILGRYGLLAKWQDFKHKYIGNE
jgi:hypothetical protein